MSQPMHMPNAAKRPEPTTCQQCGHSAAVAVCPLCGTERAAYTALKNITARERGVQPINAPLPTCRYAPEALCDCGGRGLCLDVA